MNRCDSDPQNALGKMNFDETEIIQYAEFLGIDLNSDSDLIWIAEHGLRAT